MSEEEAGGRKEASTPCGKVPDMASRVGVAGSKERWRYSTSHQAPGHHVRVVVDASDLPGNLAEARAEKRV